MSVEMAVKIAEANDDYRRWRHGAVVKKGGAVQVVGWNRLRNDPEQLHDYSYASLHAEADCLKRMNYEAKGCVLYIARVGKNDQVALSKPCPQCQELMTLAGIKKCVYTIDNETTGVWKP